MNTNFRILVLKGLASQEMGHHPSRVTDPDQEEAGLLLYSVVRKNM